jgi:hypothetical protein
MEQAIMAWGIFPNSFLPWQFLTVHSGYRPTDDVFIWKVYTLFHILLQAKIA